MLYVRLWLFLQLVIICIADITRMIIPDVCILLMLPAALFAPGSWKNRLMAALLVWAAFLIAAAVFAIFRSPVPVGMGDVKLFSAIGLISGPGGLLFTFLTSSLVCGIISTVLLILKKVQKKDQIAFGPFIAVSYALYLASVSAM